MFVLSNLNRDLRDSNSNLIQEPEHRVVVNGIWEKQQLKHFIHFSRHDIYDIISYIRLLTIILKGIKNI